MMLHDICLFHSIHIVIVIQVQPWIPGILTLLDVFAFLWIWLYTKQIRKKKHVFSDFLLTCIYIRSICVCLYACLCGKGWFCVCVVNTAVMNFVILSVLHAVLLEWNVVTSGVQQHPNQMTPFACHSHSPFWKWRYSETFSFRE